MSADKDITCPSTGISNCPLTRIQPHLSRTRLARNRPSQAPNSPSGRLVRIGDSMARAAESRAAPASARSSCTRQ